VERVHPHPTRHAQRRDSLAHLVGRLVREGDREHVAWRHAALHEVGGPPRDHARLAAARARDHQQRTVAVLDGLSLGVAESREQDTPWIRVSWHACI
jgi:hypothetical protein